MADCLQPYHHELFTTSRLIGAYEQLVAMLAQFDINATFAFVMAFILKRDELGQFADVLEPSGPDQWLEHYRRARAAGDMEGWHLPQALEIASRDGAHEIACHGFCHRPLADDLLTPDGARVELAAARRVADMRKIRPRTLVFPRNQVGNLEQVRAAGYLGYRERLSRRRGSLGKAMGLIEELNVRPAGQSHGRVQDGMVAIPPGYFFNWRRGLRRLVPPAVTGERWRGLLGRSARSGGVAHLWLHPHNLITGPGTAVVLEKVLAEVAKWRERGELRVLTQEEYCGELLASRADEIESSVTRGSLHETDAVA